MIWKLTLGHIGIQIQCGGGTDYSERTQESAVDGLWLVNPFLVGFLLRFGLQVIKVETYFLIAYFCIFLAGGTLGWHNLIYLLKPTKNLNCMLQDSISQFKNNSMSSLLAFFCRTARNFEKRVTPLARLSPLLLLVWGDGPD